MNSLCDAKITAVNTFLTNYANFFLPKGGKRLEGGGGEAANLQSPEAEVAAIVRFAKTSKARFLVMYQFFAYNGKPTGWTNVPSPVAIWRVEPTK